MAQRVRSASSLYSNDGRSGKLEFGRTESGNHVTADPQQIIFKTSSLALLRAKGHKISEDDKTGVDGGTKMSMPPYYSTDTTKPSGYLEGAKRILDYMNTLWKSDILCDVIIQCDSRELKAHKIALGAYSDALTSKFQEFPEGEMISIDLREFSYEVVYALLKFIYTTEIYINEKNVGPLLVCSSELGITIIVDMCKEYLNNFSVETAIPYFSIAETHRMEDLKKRIYGFICNRFPDITQTAHFSYAPFEKVVTLLSDDKICASELEVFYAIVRWINHSRMERMPLAPSLLKCVRFQKISPEDLVTKVESVNFIFQPRECHNILYESMKYHALHLSGSSLATSYPLQKTRSLHVMTPQATISPAKYSTSEQLPSTQSQSYSPVSDRQTFKETATIDFSTIMTTPPSTASPKVSPRWSRFTPESPTDTTMSPKLPQTPPSVLQSTPIDSQPRSRVTSPTRPISETASPSISSRPHEHSMTSSGEQQLIMVGGVDLQSLDPDVPGRCVFSLHADGTWEELASMTEYTHHHGVAVVADILYVIGGAVYDYRRPDVLGGSTNTMYVYSHDNDSWSMGAPMKQARAYFAVTTHNGCIYAVGGEDGNRRNLDTVEKYDPSSGRWSYVVRMPSGGKIGCAVACFKDHLYIVGGYRRSKPTNTMLATVECYDLIRQRWDNRQPLQQPRCHSNLVVASGYMYLIGGRSQQVAGSAGVTSLSSVHIYNEAADVWEHVADMGVARHDAGCVAIGGKIFIVGGMQTPSPYCLDSIECFNTTTGGWEDTIRMPYPAAGTACAVMSA